MKQLFEKFLKFGIVGIANTFIYYLMYAALTYIGLFYLFSSIIAATVSLANAFYWNNKHVFNENIEKRNAIVSAFRMVISYVFSGFVIGNVLLYIFVDKFEINAYIAPFFGLCITIPLNFILNRFWVFK